MAPKKPAPKAIKSAPKKAPAPAAVPAKKPAKLTVWPAEPHTHGHDHHHHDDSCCGHHHGMKPNLLTCLCTCCPIAKIIATRSFWAASVVAFIVIFATDWILHTRFLMADYAATSNFWRPAGQVRMDLILITQIVTALSYAAIIIGMGYARKWWGSFSTGALAGIPVAMTAMSAYIMQPFASPYIPAVWAVASVLQAGLAGLAICAALRLSRAPDAGAGCCTSKPTLH